MAEFLRRIPGVNSPSILLEVSPRRQLHRFGQTKLSSQTPISSVPSPATGSANATGSFSDAQWILRNHRHSFRPLLARHARPKVEAAVESEIAHSPHSQPANNSMLG